MIEISQKKKQMDMVESRRADRQGPTNQPLYINFFATNWPYLHSSASERHLLALRALTCLLICGIMSCERQAGVQRAHTSHCARSSRHLPPLLPRLSEPYQNVRILTGTRVVIDTPLDDFPRHLLELLPGSSALMEQRPRSHMHRWKEKTNKRKRKNVPIHIHGRSHHIAELFRTSQPRPLGQLESEMK